jgi:hypothetical protein
VRPIDIYPRKPGAEFIHNGVELQPSDRLDLLVTFDQPPGVYFLRVDRWVGEEGVRWLCACRRRLPLHTHTLWLNTLPLTP